MKHFSFTSGPEMMGFLNVSDSTEFLRILDEIVKISPVTSIWKFWTTVSLTKLDTVATFVQSWGKHNASIARSDAA